MKVGIVGATGLVGKKLVKLLENTILPLDEIRFIASKKSIGNQIIFKNKQYSVVEISNEVFESLDLVFFVATKQVAKEYVPIALEKNCVVIDNSSRFRMEKTIPLVVPEVNIEEISSNQKLIANPNCSTIQLVVVLGALKKIGRIKRVDVSTYQAVSGAGKIAIDELEEQIKNYQLKNVDAKVLPVKDLDNHYPILNNVIPQIDKFSENGYTFEELKVIKETNKILNDNIAIHCTAVRVPVMNGHSESVTVFFEDNVNIKKVNEVLMEAENIIVKDNPMKQIYPLALDSCHHTEVFVGRIRKDLFDNNILHFWNVADNLLKGAAANALQIAEKCYRKKIFGW